VKLLKNEKYNYHMNLTSEYTPHGSKISMSEGCLLALFLAALFTMAKIQKCSPMNEWIKKMW
jgi:hypothetical protein